MSPGIVIKDLSTADKRFIPFVERVLNNTKLGHNKIVIG